MYTYLLTSVGCTLGAFVEVCSSRRSCVHVRRSGLRPTRPDLDGDERCRVEGDGWDEDYIVCM